jgi:hypothetical protein
MDTKNLELKVDGLKSSIDILILIELSKRGAKREDVRDLLGSLDNNMFSKINKIINGKVQK